MFRTRARRTPAGSRACCQAIPWATASTSGVETPLTQAGTQIHQVTAGKLGPGQRDCMQRPPGYEAPSEAGGFRIRSASEGLLVAFPEG